MPLRTALLRRALPAVASAAILGIGAGCAAVPTSPTPAAYGSTESSYLVSLVNSTRGSWGLPGLAVANDATWKAQSHAQDMANAGTIFHSSSLSSGLQPGWTAIGENVGSGGSVDAIENAFMGSSQHRANILSGSFDQIGVGIARSANGTVFVCEIFVGR